MAEKIRVASSTISRWERRITEPRPAQLQELCSLLNARDPQELGFHLLQESERGEADDAHTEEIPLPSQQQSPTEQTLVKTSQNESSSITAPRPLEPPVSNSFLLAKRPLPRGGFLGASPEGVLVGCDEELQQIQRIIRAVQTTGGRLLMLVGEPGVGKTRLAQEVGVLARSQQFFVATGRCYEPHQAVAYYPFLELFETFSTALPPAALAEVSQHWPDLTKLLPNAPLLRPDTRPSNGQEDQQRLFWAVTHWLQTVAETQPIALFLDDLQWADTASLLLLQHLTQQRNRCPQRGLPQFMLPLRHSTS